MDNIKDFEVNSPRWLSLEDFEGEVWKEVPGFNGDYMVSNMGRVKTISRTIQFKGRGGGIVNRKYPTRILRAHNNGHGYLWESLGGRKDIKRYLHRLVATAFIPNPQNKPDIDHINTVRGDNRAINLRWVTKSENMMNVITQERNRLSQGDPVVILNCWGEYITEFTSAVEAADFFNVAPSVVKDAISQKRKSRTLCGYIALRKKNYDTDKDYSFMYKRGNSPFIHVPSENMILVFRNGCLSDVIPNVAIAAGIYNCTHGAISTKCIRAANHRVWKFKTKKGIQDDLWFYKDVDEETQKKALIMFKEKYPYPAL